MTQVNKSEDDIRSDWSKGAQRNTTNALKGLAQVNTVTNDDEPISPTEQREIDEMLAKDKLVDALQAIFFPDQGYVLGKNRSKLFKAADLLTADRDKAVLDAEIESNEAWLALDRPIDPREFQLEAGRLELRLQAQRKAMEDTDMDNKGFRYTT
jgi:hypothetical protein